MAYVIPLPEGFKLPSLDKAVKTAYFRCTREVTGLEASVLMRFPGVALYCAPSPDLIRVIRCLPAVALREGG
jgi:hypothetical protein